MNTEASPVALPKDPRTLREWLATISPTFKECKPLALRIDASILERYPELDRKTLRSALRLYTGSTRYLKALEKGQARFDLDGNEAGPVTEEQRTHAAETLKTRFAEAARQRREAQKAEEAERRRTEKLQQLVGRFAKPTNSPR